MLRTLATWVKPWRTLSSGRCPERASPRKLFRAVVQVITARLPGLEQVVEALLLGGPWLGRPRWPRTPWREQSRTEGCFKETGVARAVQGRLVQRGCPALGRAEGGPWSEGEPGWVGLAESLSLRDAEWPGQAPAHTCSWKRDPPGRRPEAPGLGTGPRRLPSRREGREVACRDTALEAQFHLALGAWRPRGQGCLLCPEKWNKWGPWGWKGGWRFPGWTQIALSSDR